MKKREKPVSSDTYTNKMEPVLFTESQETFINGKEIPPRKHMGFTPYTPEEISLFSQAYSRTFSILI